MMRENLPKRCRGDETENARESGCRNVFFYLAL